MAEAVLEVKVETKDAEKGISGLESAFKGLGVVAGAVAAIFAGKKVIQFFEGGIDAALDQERALSSLSQQLKLTGDFSKEAVSSFTAFADELESTTKFGDDLILSQLAVAKSFGVTNDQAKDLVAAATELSAVTGDSLETSVNDLGKTLQGVVPKGAALKSALAGISKEGLEAGQGLAAVTKRFGGSAAADLDTFGGALKQLGNSFGNLQEAFGNVVVNNPAFVEALKIAKEVLNELVDLVSDNEQSFKDFVADGIEFAVKGFAQFVRVSALVVDALKPVAQIVNLVGIGFVETIRAALQFEAVRDVFNLVFFGIAQLLEPIKLVGFGIDTILSAAGIDTKLGETLAELEAQADKLATTVAEADLDAGVGKIADNLAELGIAATNSFDDVSKGLRKGADDAEAAADRIAKAKDKIKKDSAGIAAAGSGGGSKDNGFGDFLNKPKAGAANQSVNGSIDPSLAALIEEQRKIDDTEIQNFVDRMVSDFSKNLSAAGDQALAGFVGGIQKGGRDGARQAVAAAGGAVATVFGGPGVGQAVQGALDFLGQDPEAFKAAIEGFVEGIPTVIDAIVENIPVLVVTLAENIGPIITALASAMPEVAIALANAMPAVGRALESAFREGVNYQVEKSKSGADLFAQNVEEAGHTFAVGFKTSTDAFGAGLKAVGGELSQSIKDGIANAFSDFGPGLQSIFEQIGQGLLAAGQLLIDTLTGGLGGGGEKGGVAGAFQKAGKAIGLASGGTIPPGFNNDTFPAFLSSGELVVPQDDVANLRALVASQSQGGGDQSGLTAAILNQILAALSSPQQVATTVTVDGSKLADVMLSLNRRNARVA